VVMTAFGNIGDAVTAMKKGAEDYLQKPLDLDQIDLTLSRVLKIRQLKSENRMLKEAFRDTFEFDNLISASPAMEAVLSMAGRAAQSRATVLLRGESGTGKEVLARAIHLAGPRKEQPFVAVNVAALPENLVESELFGHEKGAFTGADRQRKGRFEAADGGTLFIDEIGDIPPSIQVKLLRVIQEQAFERIGGTETIPVDVRLMAATHQDLEKSMAGGTFREDLFFRLNVISITLPPLRSRREEIPVYVDHFLRKYSRDEGKEVHSLSGEAMHRLMEYSFPGNVRELENIMHRAVVLVRGDMVTVDDLPPHLDAGRTEPEPGPDSSLTEQVEALERHLIRKNLARSGGNQSEAARRLGITERNLRYKLNKYKLK